MIHSKDYHMVHKTLVLATTQPWLYETQTGKHNNLFQSTQLRLLKQFTTCLWIINNTQWNDQTKIFQSDPFRWDGSEPYRTRFSLQAWSVHNQRQPWLFSRFTSLRWTYRSRRRHSPPKGWTPSTRHEMVVVPLQPQNIQFHYSLCIHHRRHPFHKIQITSHTTLPTKSLPILAWLQWHRELHPLRRFLDHEPLLGWRSPTIAFEPNRQPSISWLHLFQRPKLRLLPYHNLQRFLHPCVQLRLLWLCHRCKNRLHHASLARFSASNSRWIPRLVHSLTSSESKLDYKQHSIQRILRHQRHISLQSQYPSNWWNFWNLWIQPGSFAWSRSQEFLINEYSTTWSIASSNGRAYEERGWRV